MAENNETIRWPTNLDRRAIEQRLITIAERAAEFGLTDELRRFVDVKAMTAAQIATSVVAALTSLFNRPEHERARVEVITKELEMVALNLKNLK